MTSALRTSTVTDPTTGDYIHPVVKAASNLAYALKRLEQLECERDQYPAGYEPQEWHDGMRDMSLRVRDAMRSLLA